ncbi:MAG: hypothetical protein AAF725_19895, partial [Acidobacteriota bacterium]
DNTLVDPRWLERVVEALEAHPGALGFESYYSLRDADPALNRYLTGLLQISDPWAKAVSRPLRLIEEKEHVQVFELPADGAYPTGANGFVFRRQLIERLGDRPFHEATFFPGLIRRGTRVLLKRRDCRVHHDYVRGLSDFYRKKQRVALHYLLRREEVAGGWDAELPAARKWLAMLHCASVVGPALEGLIRALRERRAEWLLHAPASLVTVLATATGLAKSALGGTRENRARVSQSLKPDP